MARVAPTASGFSKMWLLLVSSCVLAVEVPLSGCQTIWGAAFVRPQKSAAIADRSAPFAKIHGKNGEVYVLVGWTIDDKAKVIAGHGILYDMERKKAGDGSFVVPFDEIAMLETNRPEKVLNQEYVVLGVVTAATVAGAATCAAIPKACFGSCPTFYISENGRQVLAAEGFSSSVSKIFEKTDVDHLYSAVAGGGDYSIVMKNEALETHAVRWVKLISVPRRENERVFRSSQNIYYTAGPLVRPLACDSIAGDCRAQLESADGDEYRSKTDGKDLSTKETLYLKYPQVRGKTGIVISARNSLVNTFLFYQELAYMGMNTGDVLMKLDRGWPEVESAIKKADSLIGSIEVEILTGGTWKKAGSFDELGPIARDVQIVPLPEGLPDGETSIRLVMTRGYWKIDMATLVGIGGPVAPRKIELSTVERKGTADGRALSKLLDPEKYLYTYPGDEYTLHFTLPEGSQELFLESRGYYIEWLREQWLAEEDPAKAAEMLIDPDAAMKKFAPAYSRIEDEVEEVFWKSKVGR